MAVQASAIIESVKFLAHENRSFCDTDTDSSNREQNRARKESSLFVRASLFYKTIELIQKGHDGGASFSNYRISQIFGS